jgi:hypothetical protein
MIDNEPIPQNEQNFQDVGRDEVPQVQPEASEEIPAEPEVAQAAPTVQETAQQSNFKALREQARQLELEKAELARQLSAYQQQQQQKQESYEQEDNIDPDALVEGKHLTRYAKKIKHLEEELEKQRRHTVESTAELQLRARYSDFDAIVNTDNLEMLKLTYPELAQTIYNNPDLYTKGSSAYTIIKQMGIAQNTLSDRQKERVEANLAKPRPLASIASAQGNNSPLQRANAFENGLTEDVQKQLWRETVECMKKV